jgi:hypothetical protein
VEPLDLQYNNNLQTLKLLFYFPSHVAMPAVLTTLSRVSSHSIGFLAIGAYTQEFGHGLLEDAHFSALELILQRPQFVHLRTLTFETDTIELLYKQSH